ncbi:hypothetical protein [Hymenobacter elongatus]|uniref:Uncharacterized protein n=1 Tax=Hymenobacter elongatus TaxID=877208 RepID=A0A4Z0PLT2_9BACT|nr:hypothetical protein [Hymenobacter elongatus]TGE16606.1 hypothetical protein E5J99_09520 [Hymenobacter elongatus]
MHQVLIDVDAVQVLLYPLFQVGILPLVDGRAKLGGRARVLAIVGNGLQNLAVVGILKLLYFREPRYFVEQNIGGEIGEFLQFLFHWKRRNRVEQSAFQGSVFNRFLRAFSR